MSGLKKFFQSIVNIFPEPMRNKYFLVLAIFAGWMIFFDKHDVLTQWSLNKTVNKLEQDKDMYSKKIEAAEEKRLELEVEKERFARERYYMKKSGEDVFVIIDEEEELGKKKKKGGN